MKGGRDARLASLNLGTGGLRSVLAASGFGERALGGSYILRTDLIDCTGGSDGLRYCRKS